MGYNANMTRVAPIPTKRAAAGTAILHVITAPLDQRITCPSLRLRAGAAGGTLLLLQTEAVFRFTQGLTADAVVTVPGIPAGVANRNVVIRDPNGDCKVFKIQSQTGEDLTLSGSVPANTRCMLYLLGSDASANTSRITLTANGSTVLSAECPGVIIAREPGWPLALFLENTDGNAELESGTVAYISI